MNCNRRAGAGDRHCLRNVITVSRLNVGAACDEADQRCREEARKPSGDPAEARTNWVFSARNRLSGCYLGKKHAPPLC